MLIWTQAATTPLPETYCERSHGRNNVEELDILDMTEIQKRSGICKKGHVQRKGSVKQSKSHFDVRELSTASVEKSVCDLCSGVPLCSQLCWGDTEPQSCSHSASGALAPEPDPEGLLYHVREIIFPKNPSPVLSYNFQRCK